MSTSPAEDAAATAKRAAQYRVAPPSLEAFDTDEVVHWLAKSVRLPQYASVFRENEVDGLVLLDMVEHKCLDELVDSRIHQSRLRAAVTRLRSQSRDLRLAKRSGVTAPAVGLTGARAGATTARKRSAPNEMDVAHCAHRDRAVARAQHGTAAGAAHKRARLTTGVPSISCIGAGTSLPSKPCRLQQRPQMLPQVAQRQHQPPPPPPPPLPPPLLPPPLPPSPQRVQPSLIPSSLRPPPPHRLAPPLVASPSAAHEGATLVYARAPSAQFSCALCLEAVAEQPSSLPVCDHVFCRRCLLGALDANRRCPTCRAVVAWQPGQTTNEKLVQRARVVAELIEELEVHCPNGVCQVDGVWMHERGSCPVVLPRAELAAHLRICTFTPVACSEAARGCAWRGARGALAAHAQHCWFRQGRAFLEKQAHAEANLLARVQTNQSELAALRAQIQALQDGGSSNNGCACTVTSRAATIRRVAVGYASQAAQAASVCDAGIAPLAGETVAFERTIGSEGSGDGQFYEPRGVAALGSGRIVVADTHNSRVIVLSADDGAVERTIGSRGSGDGQFNQPFGVTSMGAGRIAVADTLNHRVVVLSADTGVIEHAIGREGSGDGHFNLPRGVAWLGDGRLAVADSLNHRVVILDAQNGRFVRTIGTEGRGNGQLDGPAGLAYIGDGRIAVADTLNHRVVVLRADDGSLERIIGRYGCGDGHFNEPYAIAWLGGNRMAVCDNENNRVVVLDMSGHDTAVFERTIGSYGTGDGQFSNPYGLTCLDDGRVAVADWFNDRVVLLR